MTGPRHSSGRDKVWLAAALYAAMYGGALLWAWLRGRTIWYDPERFSWPLLGIGAAAGVALGLTVVALSRLLLRLGWARRLERWFRAVLGPLTPAQVLALAALSSVGEEALFRGAMQPDLGLWATSAIFGLLHITGRREHLPWTAMAVVLGLAFGALTRTSGNLAGAVLAHFIINLLNLWHIAGAARGPGGSAPPRAPDPPGDADFLPGPEAPPSMGDHEADRTDHGSAGGDDARADDEPRRGGRAEPD